jgi:hypothetical protein
MTRKLRTRKRKSINRKRKTINKSRRRSIKRGGSIKDEDRINDRRPIKGWFFGNGCGENSKGETIMCYDDEKCSPAKECYVPTESLHDNKWMS